MPDSMGWYIGGKPWTNYDTICWKRKDRWLFVIEDVTGGASIKCLPPQKTARPTISFKEAEIQHVNEIVYSPVKPEWKPIQLTLYDVKKDSHPVFDWICLLYDPSQDAVYKRDKGIASCYEQSCWQMQDGFKKTVRLELYDGCGYVIESWVFENAWPQEVEFGDLEMSSGDVVTCQITLRYDRAYVESN